MRCHALVWHSQLAPWVEAQNWTAEEATEIITTHITNVAGYWKGRCYAWDVVNEALLDDGTWRPSPFYNALGPDYIKLAFRVASETDPDAKLYYNDYNLERPGPKATAAAGIAQTLIDAGIRIDGIGMQSHSTAGRAPSLKDQVEVMEQYAETGVEVALTELDGKQLLDTIFYPFRKKTYPIFRAHFEACCGHLVAYSSPYWHEATSLVL